MLKIDPKIRTEAEFLSDKQKEQLEYDYKLIEASVNKWERDRNKKLKDIKEDKKKIKKCIILSLICTAVVCFFIYIGSDLNQGFRIGVVGLAIIQDIIMAIIVIPILIELNKKEKELKG